MILQMVLCERQFILFDILQKTTTQKQHNQFSFPALVVKVVKKNHHNHQLTPPIACLSVRPSVSVCPCTLLSICLSVRPYVPPPSPSVCLSVCLSDLPISLGSFVLLLFTSCTACSHNALTLFSSGYMFHLFPFAFISSLVAPLFFLAHLQVRNTIELDSDTFLLLFATPLQTFDLIWRPLCDH